MAIHQGDQYPLPVQIMQGNNPLTPDDVTDLRIKVGCYLKSLSWYSENSAFSQNNKANVTYRAIAIG